ncbi:hypothetical protein ACG04R_23435 [Roseateles sp. BYS78W]|uniref:Uncharacterized protein n=1 Tax=Pelomonas candidula TaxID=3299025 RepID=A0ABW7HI99_9BURK
MTPLRWTLTLLAAGAAAAGLLLLAREPADGPPPPAPQPLAPASSTSLPAAASAATTAASGILTATLPARPATSAPPPPRIGSEGYGPHIDRAQAGNDAQAAWEAVQWLRNCTSTEARRNSFENVRNQGVAPELMTQLMVEADAEARRCQTVTAQHRAMLPELAARAMRGGVPEAASAYAESVFPGDLTPAQRQEVANAMRRDANAGDALSLLGAMLANEAWGLSDAEKLGYLTAYGNLPDQPDATTTAKTLLEQGIVRFKAPPTPEQLAVAKQAAQAIVERARAKAMPR